MTDRNAAPGVYGILCLHNRKFYIGSSGNVRQRLDAHRSQLRGNQHRQLPRLQKDWNKFGESGFAMFPLSVPPRFRKEEYERYLIETLHTLEHEQGYNRMIGDRWGIEASIRNTEIKFAKSGKFRFLAGVDPETPMLMIYIQTFKR